MNDTAELGFFGVIVAVLIAFAGYGGYCFVTHSEAESELEAVRHKIRMIKLQREHQKMVDEDRQKYNEFIEYKRTQRGQN